jgi:CheY-like chemotaxis protein
MPTPNLISAPNRPEASPQGQADGRAHVLVLDDDPALRELFGAMLERMGCSTIICSSSVEAINAYRSAGMDTKAIDCALIDLHIDEKVDGVAIGRMLREIDPLVRLILVSGSVNPKKLAAHRALGFDTALPKPFSIKQLQDAIFPQS